MQGYRAAAPPHLEVKLGPLPLGVVHFVVPVLIGLLGLLIAGWIVHRVVRGPTPIVLRCTRAAGAVTCEEWQGRPLVKTQEASAGHGSVQYRRISGKTSKTCVAIGRALMCGGNTKENVARIAAIEPLEKLELDASDRSPAPIIVSATFGVIVLILAGAYLVSALGRLDVLTLRLTPTTLEVIDKRGTALHTLMRSPREEVRVVQVRSARGEGRKWEVAYGDTPPITAITSFRAKDRDLEPLAATLRKGLADLPPLAPQ